MGLTHIDATSLSAIYVFENAIHAVTHFHASWVPNQA